VRLLVALSLLIAHTAVASPDRELRVCADPNNFPFTHSEIPGFENAVAAVIGRALEARVEYTWRAQRRGFLRETLLSGDCDVVLAAPYGMARVRTTQPYYRSVYVIASRADKKLDIRSLDDPRLRTLRVGVELVGDDGANPPPVHALAQRGIVDNVVGFLVTGDYREPSPPTRVMEALVAGRIDVALVWGPLAGGFAHRSRVPIAIAPLPPRDGAIRLAFDIALAVRPADRALAAELDRVLVDHRAEIARVLDTWRIPRVETDR